ncbi:hypothetical protein INT47_000543 [Mucor saturninus]|uniref:Uncharacterized protein n=1 Tax=Mucor saturninus TaxID=64648 RepID=A0A8H7URP7_9FUNG|nr:hypothetical protein INT47_000543 [Mucor saturninus]
MPTVIEPFSPFDNQKGYAGYTPTQTPYMDKQMMLLGGKVLKGDHSFKIIKHMASVDETNMFNALYTICNEFEEIRMMLLVPSKSLEHLKWSFQKMMQAYEGYGHDSPVVFYTDNVRGDRCAKRTYSKNIGNPNLYKLSKFGILTH